MSASVTNLRLPVCVTRTLSKDGEAIDETVFCPVRDKTLTVEDCEVCQDYAGISADVANHRDFVVCKRMTIDGARRLVAARPVPCPPRERVDRPSLADRTPVSQIMRAEVVCVREDLPVQALTELLLGSSTGGVPVVDDHGQPIGMVSRADLLRDHSVNAQAADLMTPLVFYLPERATVAQAAALMAFEGIHRLPVLSEDGKVCGILSTLDLLEWLARTEGYLKRA